MSDLSKSTEQLISTAQPSAESLRVSHNEDDSPSLYLHFPFCSKICGYCDFHKELFNHRKEALYFQALTVDTALAAEELYEQRIRDNKKTSQKTAQKITLQSIYIGGGTPSLISQDLFGLWVEQLGGLFDFAEDLEFTVEVNPESANQENLSLFQKAGVNRLSVGVQSFNSKSLVTLDRRHKIEDTLRVFYVAHALGIENISADLIFGLPNQTLHQLERDLYELLELEPSHISFYQLTVKDNTPLAQQVAAGTVRMPDNDTMAQFYRFGHEYFAEHNYRRYEISSFAKDGAKSRHNIRYWTNVPYLALGPGAHGYNGEHRYALVSNTEAYVDSLLNKKQRPLTWDRLTDRDRVLEDVMLALRTTEGLDITRFRKRHGRSPEEVFVLSEYKKLIDSGHLLAEKRRLRLSEDSLALADEIIARLVV